MPERLKGPVLKTGVPARIPWVRIPLPPPTEYGAWVYSWFEFGLARDLLSDFSILRKSSNFGGLAHGLPWMLVREAERVSQLVATYECYTFTVSKIPTLRLCADLQGGCQHGHLSLHHLQDELKLLGKVLHNGLRAEIAEEVDKDDHGKPIILEVPGSLLFDEKCQMWVAVPDWPEFSSPNRRPDPEEHARVVTLVNAQIKAKYGI